MRHNSLKLLIAITLLAVCGCGTLENTMAFNIKSLAPPLDPVQSPRFAPFGGVAKDVEWVRTANQPIDVIDSVVDMPFSLVGDLVTLPWVAYERLIVGPRPSRQDEWRRFWMNESPTVDAPPAPAAKTAQESHE